MRKRALAAAVLAGMATQASAFHIDTSEDWEVRWDNTFKYNLQQRVQSQDSDVIENANSAAESSYSFDKGDITSNRLDLLSELDVIWKDTIGFRISGAAWYDHAYSDDMNQAGDVSIYAYGTALTSTPGELNDEVKKRHYKGGELLDAFVFWNWEAGDVVGNIRAGRHVIYWGQSLLPTAAVNTAGNAMNPLDFAKGLSVPGSEAKELFRPTNKISTMVQLTDNLTLSAFYGMETEANLYPRANSYMSPSSAINDGTEVIWPVAGAGLTLLNDDIDDDGGEWGVNLSYYFEDLGLEASAYFVNYTDRTTNGLTAVLTGAGVAAAAPLLSVNPADAPVLGYLQGVANGEAVVAPTLPDLSDASPIPLDLELAGGFPAALHAGYAKWVYKNDIELYGISFAKQVGDVSVGVDLAYHKDRPLRVESGYALLGRSVVGAATAAGALAAGAPAASVPNYTWDMADFNAIDPDSNYPHVTGDTWTVVVNALGLLSDNGLWEGGSYIVEATFTMVDDINDDNPIALLDTDLDNSGKQNVAEGRVTSHIAAVFRPTWYQVMPGVDLTVPVSVSYQIDGDAPTGSSGDEEFGSASIGLDFSVNQKWSASLKYNNYFGPVANTVSQLKDRDNISFTVKRTF